MCQAHDGKPCCIGICYHEHDLRPTTFRRMLFDVSKPSNFRMRALHAGVSLEPVDSAETYDVVASVTAPVLRCGSGQRLQPDDAHNCNWV